MTYHNAIKYILNAPTKNGAAESFERIRILSERLGSPHRHVKYVRFGGSNGKTVCQTMLSRILTESKIKVGSLLMPARDDPRENILICDEPLSMQDTVRYVSRIAEAVIAIKSEIEVFKFDDSILETDIPESIISGKIGADPTKNEIIFLMALLAFSEAGCSICLIECDHNGADPTKMLEPPFSTVICGTIPGENTKETYRIRSYLQKGITEVVSAPQNGETYKIISAACARINCRLSVPTRSQLEIKRLSLGGSEFSYKGEDYSLGLCGRFQIHNATTVLETVQMLERSGFKINRAAIKRALSSVSVRSKFETLSVFPTIIADSTHKSEAVETMCETLVDFKQQTGESLCLCISPDRELTEEYVRCLGAHGYSLREIIIVGKSDDAISSDNSQIKISTIESHRAAAKALIAAAKESGFVLITGDEKTADSVRKEVLRILEF